jgi:hypothetical protein
MMEQQTPQPSGLRPSLTLLEVPTMEYPRGMLLLHWESGYFVLGPPVFETLGRVCLPDWHLIEYALPTAFKASLDARCTHGAAFLTVERPA